MGDLTPLAPRNRHRLLPASADTVWVQGSGVRVGL